MHLVNLKNIKLKFLSPSSLIILILPISFLFGTLVSEFLLFTTIIISIFNKNLLYDLKDKILNNLEVKILLAIYILLILNTFFSSNIENSFLRNFGFIRLILFTVFLQFYFKNVINTEKIFKLWTLIILIVVFDLYYELKFGQNIFGFKSTDPLRLVGFLDDEQKIGTFIIGFFFPLLAFWLGKIKKKSNLLIFSIFVAALFLILFIFLPIGQRSVAIKVYISFAVFFIIFPNISVKAKLIFVFLLIFLLGTIISNNEKLKIRYYYSIFNTQNYHSNETIKKDYNFLENFKNEYHSSHYWKHHFTAYKLFLKYPLSGVGNKNYRNECHSIKIKDNHTLDVRSGCSTHPHQIYYELLSEHGILGVIIVYLFFVIFFKNFFLFYKDRNLYRLSFICYFIFIFIPLIPTGSFFTSYNIFLFFINFAIKEINTKKKI